MTNPDNQDNYVRVAQIQASYQEHLCLARDLTFSPAGFQERKPVSTPPRGRLEAQRVRQAVVER